MGPAPAEKGGVNAAAAQRDAEDAERKRQEEARIAALAAPTPPAGTAPNATAEATVRRLGTASATEFFNLTRKPDNNNPTGPKGTASKPLTALRYLKGV